MRLVSALVLVCIGISQTSSTVIEVDPEPTDEVPYPLQAAIDRAWPGDTIVLQSGQYFESVHSTRDGEEGAPITIAGPPSAVIRGHLPEHLISVNHDYIHLEGFSVNGEGESTGDAESAEHHHEYLVHVHGNRVRTVDHESHVHRRESKAARDSLSCKGVAADRSVELRSGVVGFKADGLTLSHALSSCLKASYFVTHSRVTNNDVFNCGASEELCGESPSACGAGIDFGTAIHRRMGNIGAETDETAWNTLAKNTVSSVRGPCILLHEGTRATIVEDNDCSESSDVDGAGISIRGDGNIIRRNKVSRGDGAGLEVGGARQSDHRFGVYNQIYLNELDANDGGSILHGELPEPTGVMCKNTIARGGPEELANECPDEVATEDSDETDIQTRSHDESTPISRSHVEVEDPWHYSCSEVPLTPGDVSSSEASGEKAGNRPHVVLDNDPDTHWSRYGLHQWLEFHLDSPAGVPTIEAIDIQFFQGSSRIQFFEVSADGETVLHEGASSGATDDAELFKLPGGPVATKTIRITCNGNKPNDSSKPFSQWNSIDRVRLCQTTPVDESP